MTLKPKCSKPRLRVRPGMAELDICIPLESFEGLSGPALTVRVVEAIEEVLVAVSEAITPACPWFLGRTKREREAGYVRPEQPPRPRSITVVPPPKPMGEAEFWQRVESGRLPAARSTAMGARFAARLRLLMAELDTENNHERAEVVLGFVSDDVWEDVLVWLVLHGESRFAEMVADVEVLGRVLEEFEDPGDFEGSWLAELEG